MSRTIAIWLCVNVFRIIIIFECFLCRFWNLFNDKCNSYSLALIFDVNSEYWDNGLLIWMSGIAKYFLIGLGGITVFGVVWMLAESLVRSLLKLLCQSSSNYGFHFKHSKHFYTFKVSVKFFNNFNSRERRSQQII